MKLDYDRIEIDFDHVERMQAVARQERSRAMYRLLIAPLVRFFSEPPKRRSSRMLRRHTAFG